MSKVRANQYVDRTGTGAIDTPYGVNTAGIVTASYFYGDGANLTNVGMDTSNVVSVATTTTKLNVVGDAQVGGALTITGNLTVDGTETIVNTETLNVADKTVGIGSTTNASDTTADGAGIEIYASSASLNNNKTLTWVNSTDRWTFAGGDVQANAFYGNGANLTGIEAGISTETTALTNGIATLDLTKDDHKITAVGITTITCQGAGKEGASGTIRITNSGICTVGFSTYFLWPSGASPSIPTADGSINVISYTIQRVGTAGTQLLSGASLSFS